MSVKDFVNGEVGALPAPGWAPPMVGWAWGPGDWGLRSFVIESKLHSFELSLPPKQTFSGSLIRVTEWISAGSALLYRLARQFHLLRRPSCSSTSKWQSQEGWRESFRDCLQMPYHPAGGESWGKGTHFSRAVQNWPNLLKRSNSSLKDLAYKEGN